MTANLVVTLAALTATAALVTVGVMRALRAGISHDPDYLLYLQDFNEFTITSPRRRPNGPLTWTQWWLLAAARAGMNPDRPAGRIAAGAAVVGALAGAAVYPGGLTGCAIGLLAGPALFLAGLQTAAARRQSVIDGQLAHLVAGLRAGIHAGATPSQALRDVADFIPAPLGDDIEAVARRLSVAVPLPKALAELCADNPSRDLRFLAACINVAVAVDADLGPQLDTIDGMLTDRWVARQRVQATLAKARAVAVIAIVVLALTVLHAAGNATFTAAWASPSGPAWLTAAFGCAAVGTGALAVIIRSGKRQ